MSFARALIVLIAVCHANQSLFGQAVVVGRETGLWGDLEIATGATINIGRNQDGRTAIDLRNGTVSVLENDRIVKEAKIVSDHHTALLLIFRVGPNNVGLWYERMMAIRLTGSSNATNSFEIRHMMDAWLLQNRDGRQRTILTIGAVDRFPLVSLRVATNRKTGVPTLVDTGWETWNLEREKPE